MTVSKQSPLIARTAKLSSQTSKMPPPVPGPGGGESLNAPMEPRFRRTDELFEDPSSRRTMRVWLDPATGERRYRAER